jgi:class 3 adenylate cyclase/tetratricopeptide (TPR) repeat protein
MLGERIGSYEVLEEIGRGGMATVYRARQASVDRDVAIKAIRGGIASDPEAVQRFQREARLIARLEHPHILPIYDFDGAHDPPYLVMRYMDSGTLEDVMEQGLLPHDEVAYLMRQVCSALDYAHRQGIVHRDVKPSNIMIDQQGNAFVSDLGIARIAAEAGGRQITATGAIIGTPDYMSPEQAQGRDDVDARADIYALGAMLYQMLCGEVPYVADSPMNVLMKHIHEPLPPLREKNPTVPPQAQAVVHKAMAKDRQERYADVLELSRALNEALGGTATAEPARLREAAGTSIIRRSGGRRKTTGVATTPSEQNRQVTALYANAAEYASLVDGVAGGEASRRAMTALHGALDSIIAESHGKVLTASDSDVLALWGAEAASESDAERAVRAALSMQAALRSLGAAFLGDGEEALPLGIGIHSGVTLLTPSDRPGSISASGSTISLANRLMQNAGGLVLITHDTYRQVRGVFDVLPDLPLRMRGRSEPVDTYRVMAAKPHAFRLNTRGVEGVETRMIGREAELKHLQNAFLDAFEDGETHIVTIAGEAGVGKSRLLYEFAEWGELRPEHYFIFRGRATPEARERPFGLLRDLLAYRFRVQDNDPPPLALEKLESGVAELVGMDRETAHLLGYLGGYDMSGSSVIRPLLTDLTSLTALARKAAVDLFVTLARGSNLSLYLEDLHHADDASLDLLNDLFLAEEHAHLLVVCVCRPGLFDRRPDWGSGQSSHTRIELKPLDRRESRDLAQEILKKAPAVPKAVRDLLVERAEGNPYYMEELIKMLIDDHVIVREDGEHWRIEESRLGALQVPPTLFGLIEARLDTLLAPEKLTLQRASVVGRIFYDKALAAMDDHDEIHVADLPGVLANLAKREFIFKRETSLFAGSVEYIFSQAMLRDTIYDRLLERQRKAYHRATAEWLTGPHPAQEYLVLIAEHFEKGGAQAQAVEALGRAAGYAQGRGLDREAEEIYERALPLLPPDSDPAVRLSLLLGLGKATANRGELAQAQEVLEACLGLAESLGDTRARADAHLQLSLTATNRGDYDAALAQLDAALPLALETGDGQLQANVLYGLANTHFRAGNFDRAEAACRQCIATARDLGDDTLLATAINRLGSILEQGQPEAALAEFEAALELARRIGHRRVEQAVLNNRGFIAMRAENWQPAISDMNESLKICQMTGDTLGEFITSLNLGMVYARSGSPQKARPFVASGLALGRRIGSTAGYTAIAGVEGEIRIAEGDVAGGLARIGLAQSHPATTADTRLDINDGLALWQRRLGYDNGEVEAGLRAGHALELDAVLQEIGARTG